MKYESTRNKDNQVKGIDAVLQGISDDGGLFVLRDLDKHAFDITNLSKMNYIDIVCAVLEIFFDEFSKEEIRDIATQAYIGKFTTDEITPLKKVKEDIFFLELFHGPTSAFKDVGLSLLPQVVKKAYSKRQDAKDLLILTATSGDTGKAALEGFKNVVHTNIMVFYPKEGTSHIQELQMQTQDGDNVDICAIHGNFDDAQSTIKKLSLDDVFNTELADRGLQVSFANSINIARLVPQIVYYFYAYKKMLDMKEIEQGEAINFVVPTGNFGNILAGYYAKLLGLPVQQFVCATNENNVLFDFFKSGTYNRNREFVKTNSPSMDILVSSNLERLLYYVSGQDNAYVSELMQQLNEEGSYHVSKEVFLNLQKDFAYGYATNTQTLDVIKDVYEESNYVMDPHTAVAYKVFKEQQSNHKSVILSTASPYKFPQSVCEALFEKEYDDDFEAMEYLKKETGLAVPSNLENLKDKEVRFDAVIEKGEMEAYILEKATRLHD